MTITINDHNVSEADARELVMYVAYQEGDQRKDDLYEISAEDHAAYLAGTDAERDAMALNIVSEG